MVCHGLPRVVVVVGFIRQTSLMGCRVVCREQGGVTVQSVMELLVQQQQVLFVLAMMIWCVRACIRRMCAPFLT